MNYRKFVVGDHILGVGEWTVTLTRADGRQIMRESRGTFPVTEPTEEEPAEE